MASTRISNDDVRVAKSLQQQTGPGRWMLDVPGPGADSCFVLDPHIVPQKWGANLYTNATDVASRLRGLDRSYNRDCVRPRGGFLPSEPIYYKNCSTFLTTEESRALNPAWTLRGAEQNRAYFLLHDPQAHTEMPAPIAPTSTRLDRTPLRSNTCG
jgi:hypothetical protein